MGGNALSGSRIVSHGDATDRGSSRQKLLSELALNSSMKKPKSGLGSARDNPTYGDLVMHSGLEHAGMAIVGDN